MAGKEEPTGLNGLTVSYDSTYDHQIFSKNGKEVFRVDAKGVIRPHVNINFAGHTITGVSDSGLVATGGVAGVGTGDLLNFLHCQSGEVLCWEAVVTQTILPDIVAAGLDVAGDQTADDGMELYGNMLGATGVPFVAGVDPPFFFRVKFTATDAGTNGTDDFQVGFRQNELCRPAWDDYRNAAALGCTVADGTIDIQTILANAATVETATGDTYVTATAHQFKVLVDAAGAVTYQHDIATPGVLAAPTTTAAVTLTNGIAYVPFFRFLQDTGLITDLTIQEWECGFQAPA